MQSVMIAFRRPPMNPDSNVLLAAMIASYAIPIGVVWGNYRMNESTSISQIICRNQTTVLASMAVMAAATSFGAKWHSLAHLRCFIFIYIAFNCITFHCIAFNYKMLDSASICS